MTTKVMLIEDDFTMLSLLRTLLRFEKFEVVAVENDSDLPGVLDAIRRELPDIILMDVHLRQINGLDLLQAIRSDKATRSARVIMTSGIDIGQRCLEHGADAFILKPYMPEDLIQKIRQVMAYEN
jgi:CheY-like chemotaxis protein